MGSNSSSSFQSQSITPIANLSDTRRLSCSGELEQGTQGPRARKGRAELWRQGSPLCVVVNTVTRRPLARGGEDSGTSFRNNIEQCESGSRRGETVYQLLTFSRRGWAHGLQQILVHGTSVGKWVDRECDSTCCQSSHEEQRDILAREQGRMYPDTAGEYS